MGSQQKKSFQIGDVRQVGSTSTSGGSRPDQRSGGGNWDADQYRQEEWGKVGEQVSSMMGMYGFDMYGGYGYGYGMDPMAMVGDTSYIEEAASQIEAMTQATQTTLADLGPDVLSSIAPDTLLRFAFSPEDMQALDLKGEHDAIAAVRDVLTVNNPTRELMEHLIGSGQFKDVVWSGHGSKDGMWITNEEGQSELLPSKDLAAMFEDSAVQEVLINACDGGKGVDDALNAAGIDTFAYSRQVTDKEAKEDAKTFSEAGTLAAIDRSATVQNGKVVTGGEYQQAADVNATAAATAAGALGGLAGGFVGTAAAAATQAAAATAAPAKDTTTLTGVGDQLVDTGMVNAQPDPYIDPMMYYDYGLHYNYMYF